MIDLKTLSEEAKNCIKCKLSKSRTQVVFGVGNPSAELMFIGEGPGYYEDQQGEPFVGAAGKLLDKVIHETLGLLRKDVYITNVVKCRPPNNRDPEQDEIDACRPYLEEQIKLIDPKVISTLGNFATRAILGKAVNISKVRGKKIMSAGRIVMPTFHPAAILRNGSLFDSFKEDFMALKELLVKKTEVEKQVEQPTLF